ncbi:MAG: hypothetical protein HQ575_01825, partial [Candidatus Omnitrophica bacterium]|nr:hypothetical protein [Candidatus Omnitrophota bacterium]
MRISFYLSHALYAKSLIPIIVRLAKGGHDICISKNRLGFLRYEPQLYGANPTANRFVNRSSFDYVAKISGYGDEWAAVRNTVRFVFRIPMNADAIITTTKDMKILSRVKAKYPDKGLFAVGYQHMPFILSMGRPFVRKNLPEICTDVFMNANAFSHIHRFPEYISDYGITFRGFPHVEKIHRMYEAAEFGKGGRYVLVFHPGGYREIITERGNDKKTSYDKQKAFIDIVCTPILRRGLIPVIKIHPLPARYHFKEDIEEILKGMAASRSEFQDVIVESEDYFKYLNNTDTVVTFGTSGVYELFSVGLKRLIVCNFIGRSRSRKFSFMKGIF